LVGVALDPNFASDGLVYVYYTTNDATPVNRVSRFTANPGNPNVALSGETILVNNIASTNGNHNGGALQFGPDGKLYIGTGDAGVPANAQDLSNLSGKILRVNPTDGSAPADNPFVGVSGDQPEIWAYGLRNPFTMSFQPGTGTLFINDVGQNAFEEVDQGAAGANYGWPQTEGPNPPGLSGVTYPIYAYSHGTGPLQGNAIAGGVFYNPSSNSFPAKFTGDYFFGDFITGRIFVRDSATGTVTNFANPTAGGGVVDLDLLPDGRLLYLSATSGAIYQISPSTQTTVSLIAAGTGAGVSPSVSILNPTTGTQSTLPTPGFQGGVRVATGDLTGDGIEDVVAASGPGGPPLIYVYDGATGQLAAAFYAFDPSFRGGVNVAIGDVTGDGRPDLIAGTATGTSLVEVIDPVAAGVAYYFAAFPGFTGGVTVAAGDIDEDGQAEIIVGAASGTSLVSVFSARLSRSIMSFYAFGLTYPSGVNVGFANGDILTGTTSGPPVVRTFDSTGQQRLLFFPTIPVTSGGTRVSGEGDLIIAAVGPVLYGFDRLTGATVGSLPPFGGLDAREIFVG
jgi:hypothetical protein